MDEQPMDEQRDLVPELALDAEGNAVVANFTPGTETQPIDETWLRERLGALGCGEFRFLPAAAVLLFEQYKAGKAVSSLRIAEKVDATLEIHITNDLLSATLDIVPAEGGRPISKDQVLAALVDKNVSVGIQLDAINQAIAAGRADGIVIAHGEAVRNGEDGRLECLVAECRARTPRVNEDGQIDYRDLGEILVVHPGSPLMRRHHATTGSPGTNVLGLPIPPKAGKEVMFATKLAGTEFAADDPDLLVAAITGQPVVVRDGVMVEPVFTVPAVSLASGNIEFDGSVVIKGDVAAGMCVKVSGDIEVGGVVEVATLEAGGHINIRGGVLGAIDQKSGRQHYLRCGGNFHAAYAQKARIEAGDTLCIDDMAMQCELIAGRHIKVGKERRGQILGGSAEAMLSISTRMLGSPNRSATHCRIGVNPTLQKEARALAEERDQQETQLLEISKLLDLASRNPGRIRPEIVDKARQTAAQLSADIARIRTEENKLAERIALAQEARVVAEECFHDGVEVHCGTHSLRVRNLQGAGQIRQNEEGLELVPLDGAEIVA